MQSIMIDLETMGTSTNSAIIAIGAVRFSDFIIKDRFEVIVDLQSCIDVGLEIDASTVLWWMKQSDEARKQFEEEGEHICDALKMFLEWVGRDGEVEVWGNGASFDNAILSNAYKKCGILQPWDSRNDRCYRTIKNMNKNIEVERIGTYHRAVDDAETQARHLMNIRNYF